MTLPVAPVSPGTERPWAAWAALLGVGLAWGATGPLAKIATATGHGSAALALWQTLIAIALFTAGVAATGRRLPLTRRHLGFYLVCGLVGTALPHTLGYVSIRHLPVGVQTMVLSTVPMMTFAVALAVGRERAEIRRTGGLALGLVGLVMVAGPEAALPEPGQAVWLALPVIVSLSYAVENVFISAAKPRGLDALQVMCGLSWAGAALLVPVALIEGMPLVPPGFGAAEGALVASALAHVCAYFGFVWLIGHAGPVFAAQVGYIVTAVGVIVGMVAFGERHSLWVWSALGLVAVGLTLVKPRRRGPGED